SLFLDDVAHSGGGREAVLHRVEDVLELLDGIGATTKLLQESALGEAEDLPAVGRLAVGAHDVHALVPRLHADAPPEVLGERVPALYAARVELLREPLRACA